MAEAPRTLSISEASRVSGAARSTLQRAIRRGTLPLQEGGRLDVVDLERLGYIAAPNTSEPLQAELARLSYL